jgi:hypothetical protein
VSADEHGDGKENTGAVGYPNLDQQQYRTGGDLELTGVKNKNDGADAGAKRDQSTAIKKVTLEDGT